MTAGKRKLGERLPINLWRLFIALWFLLGSPLHAKTALTHPELYAIFDKAAIFAPTRELWTALVMPHIVFFALLLAVFEMIVGVLILAKGRYVTAGLAASLLFNLFLLQLGLGFAVAPGSWSDFALNRLPNLLFILVQLPLFWVRFNKSLPALARSFFRP